jgi:hypothetical protein
MRLAHFGMHRTGVNGPVKPCGHNIQLSGGHLMVGMVVLVVVTRVRVSLCLGHQMHPAFWAISWAVLLHFGVHGANIKRGLYMRVLGHNLFLHCGILDRPNCHCFDRSAVVGTVSNVASSAIQTPDSTPEQIETDPVPRMLRRW